MDKFYLTSFKTFFKIGVFTLSGHTHAMQFMIGNWSPASFVYKEWGGLFSEGDRALSVSTGIGGFIPFRFGVPGEIVVVTLRRLKVEG